MTYTRAADIYLGDASSQIYEFLARPRPAVFLNPHGIDHDGDANFAHWRCGPVVTDIAGLEGALQTAQALHETLYAPVQRRLFHYSFDLAPQSAATRGAVAIIGFLSAGASFMESEPGSAFIPTPVP